MRHLTLNGFLQRAVAYEHWRAPLDLTLRRAALGSGVSIGLALLAVWFLPELTELPDTLFLLVLDEFYQDVLDWLSWHRTLLLYSTGGSVGGYLLLLMLTSGFRVGRRAWHWATFGVVGLGAFNGLILSLLLAGFIINIILWMLMFTVALIVLAGVARVVVRNE